MRTLILLLALAPAAAGFMPPAARAARAAAAAAAATWAGYTAVVRRANQRPFRLLEILSATRLEGNATIIADKVSAFPGGGTAPDLAYDWDLLHGEAGPLDAVEWKDSGADAVKLGTKADGGAVVYSRARASGERPSPDELLAKLAMGRIVVDPEMVLDWRARIDEGVPHPRPAAGRYDFVFRDYVNHEERHMLNAERFTLDRLVVGPTDGYVTCDRGNWSIVENIKLFGVLPVKIEWLGVAEGATISWRSTRMRQGWRFLGKTTENPAASEALRRAPWHVRRSPLSDEVIFFHREGHGRLVYAREGADKRARSRTQRRMRLVALSNMGTKKPRRSIAVGAGVGGGGGDVSSSSSSSSSGGGGGGAAAAEPDEGSA
eukprot:CAMPEP_0118851916 /NCGR_PEP_ID=MMETSP1163-20130328/1159_1 /TAXON_ID=124430 /ORGANISM="Phaeomonas parva, Strain CCMP2877" /LENGTH=375 /DNA_ID=CAMNT_0006784309 /DNA_START=158 /DNA_END=1285 /DNA_ORIENTATION=+